MNGQAPSLTGLDAVLVQRGYRSLSRQHLSQTPRRADDAVLMEEKAL